MYIITNIADEIKHGPYNITKREFLELKQRFQNEFNPSALQIGLRIGIAEKFLFEETNLTEKEIYTIARFLIRSDFTIEE